MNDMMHFVTQRADPKQSKAKHSTRTTLRLAANYRLAAPTSSTGGWIITANTKRKSLAANVASKVNYADTVEPPSVRPSNMLYRQSHSVAKCTARHIINMALYATIINWFFGGCALPVWNWPSVFSMPSLKPPPPKSSMIRVRTTKHAR